jgi:hypothetical protein
MSSTTSLITRVTKSYIIGKYLSDLYQTIGKDAYLQSYIRLQHGTGSGFFGVANGGSSDCLSGEFRGITDSLGLKYQTCDEIKFVSASCIRLTPTQYDRTIHRTEHTHEINELFSKFEEEFIFNNKSFTPNELGHWVITNQIVTLILQCEQKSKGTFSLDIPFSKYTNAIYHNNTDVSQYSLLQVRQLIDDDYNDELALLRSYDFSESINKFTKSLFKPKAKHSLPPLSLAIIHHDDEYELLSKWYVYKAIQVLTETKNNKPYKWYKPENARRWRHYLQTGVKL